ncbi:hypothetical protein [Rickettsia endosymbiont of Orchestes rusci]
MSFPAEGGALLHGSKKVPYVIPAWHCCVDKLTHLRCHSREGGNPEKNSHPEFISGSITKRC